MEYLDLREDLYPMDETWTAIVWATLEPYMGEPDSTNGPEILRPLLDEPLQRRSPEEIEALGNHPLFREV